MLLCLFDVQDFTAERHDGLEKPVATLFGRAACGISLDEENLRLFAVARGAVGQLARQAGAGKHRLALHQFAGMACGVTGRGGQYHLVHDGTGIFRILFEVIVERLGDGLVHRSGHFAVAQLGFRLTLELRFGNLYGDHRGESLAEVVAVDVELQLGEQSGVVGVFLERARQRPAETGQVRAALDGVDVVHVGVDVFRKAVVVLHGHLHGNAVLFGVDVDDVFGQRRAPVLVEVLDELLEPFDRVEHFAAEVPVFVPFAPVGDAEPDALVEVGQLAEPGRQDVVTVFGGSEDGGVGQEGDFRPRVPAGADDFDFGGRGADAVGLAVYLAVAAHFHLELCGEGVHARHAHAVQSARHLVAVLREFTARVQHGEHHLQSRFALFLVKIDRDTPPVVLHGDGVVFVYRDLYVGTVTGQCLVYRVVHYFVYQMVQTPHADVADVHGRTFAHCLQSFKHLYARCGILFVVYRFAVFQFAHISFP